MFFQQKKIGFKQKKMMTIRLKVRFAPEFALGDLQNTVVVIDPAAIPTVRALAAALAERATDLGSPVRPEGPLRVSLDDFVLPPGEAVTSVLHDLDVITVRVIPI